jgi:hypothetical protein
MLDSVLAVSTERLNGLASMTISRNSFYPYRWLDDGGWEQTFSITHGLHECSSRTTTLLPTFPLFWLSQAHVSLTTRLLQHQKERAAATAFGTTGVATPSSTTTTTTTTTTERLDAASTSVPQLLPVVAQQQYHPHIQTAENYIVLPSNDKAIASLPSPMVQQPQGHFMQSTTAAVSTNATTNILLLPLLLPLFVLSWNNIVITVAAGQQLDQDQVLQLLQHQLLLLQQSTSRGFGDQLSTAGESAAAAVVSLPDHHHVGGGGSSCTAFSLTTMLQHRMYTNSNSCHHHHYY